MAERVLDVPHLHGIVQLFLRLLPSQSLVHVSLYLFPLLLLLHLLLKASLEEVGDVFVQLREVLLLP